MLALPLLAGPSGSVASRSRFRLGKASTRKCVRVLLMPRFSLAETARENRGIKSTRTHLRVEALPSLKRLRDATDPDGPARSGRASIARQPLWPTQTLM